MNKNFLERLKDTTNLNEKERQFICDNLHELTKTVFQCHPILENISTDVWSVIIREYEQYTLTQKNGNTEIHS